MPRKDPTIGNRARAAVWLALLAAIPLAALLGDHGCSHPTPCRILGIALLAVAVRGAAVTGRYLAAYGQPERRGWGPGTPTKLVTLGPYSCMRHPMHLFLSLTPPALALLTASKTALLAGTVETLLILALAATLDEKDAQARFGSQYLEYKRKVPPYNPHPRCLAKALTNPPPKPPRKPSQKPRKQ